VRIDLSFTLGIDEDGWECGIMEHYFSLVLPFLIDKKVYYTQMHGPVVVVLEKELMFLILVCTQFGSFTVNYMVVLICHF
jgi:hypothetical protein